MADPNIFRILTRRGIADADQETAINGLIAALNNPDAKVLLHLHGGLIDEAAGKAIADRLSGKGPDSWNLGADWTQAYVIWRTGALETIETKWSDLAHQDRLYQTLVRKLLGFVARKLHFPAPDGRSAAGIVELDDAEIRRRLLGEGDRRAPFSDVDQRRAVAASTGRALLDTAQSDPGLAIEFQDELAADPEFQAAIGDLDGVVNEGLPGRAALPAADAERGAESLARLDEAIRLQLVPLVLAGAPRGPISVGAIILKYSLKIALRCFRRFRTDRDHGLHATVVEEVCRQFYLDRVGAAIWGEMVQYAADHFDAAGLGAALCDGVKDGIKARLAVTAHSAGSIWASRLLQALAARKVAGMIDLYLLAPAVRSSLFAQTLVKADHLLRHCRMLTMDDEHERKDAVLGHDKGYIYPSSLLYLVSGLFERDGPDPYPDAPLLGMQRFAAGVWMTDPEAADAAKIATFFQQPGHSIVYGPKGGITMSDTHGGFDDDPVTLATISASLNASL